MKLFQAMGLIFVSVFLILPNVSFASDDDNDNDGCPVYRDASVPAPEFFGLEEGSDKFRCVKKRNNVKVVFNIRRLCRDAANACGNDGNSSKMYALHAIRGMILDYEITNGMKRGKDYHIVAVVYASAWKMVANDVLSAEHKAQVTELIDKGVDFYMCSHTAKRQNLTADRLIPGVKYISQCVTGLVDFQNLGYKVVTSNNE